MLFVPDRCLGQNIAQRMGKRSCVIGDESDPKLSDIICFNGFCSVHQHFSVEDIEFYREKYDDILIIAHPECPPEVCNESDFVGSTSQMIKYIESLPKSQKIAVATEFNLVNRLRQENTYILSASKPSCPTMNETKIEDLYQTLLAVKEDKEVINEIKLDEETIHYANIALNKMFDINR